METTTTSQNIISCLQRLFMVLLVINTISKFSSAQNQNDVWYFGNHSGIDFSGALPVAISNAAMNAYEGSASECDNNGNLIFYTDGVTIWDKNDHIMPNGSGLKGGSSSTQAALIVNIPSQPGIYYVFTVGDQYSNGGIYYSLVDMSLNGGLGDIVAGKKNIMLLFQSTEAIAGVLKYDRSGVWVIVHELNNNNFDSYLVNSGGVSDPIVSSMGNLRDWAHIIGPMKISPNGNFIVYETTFGSSQIELFTFNQKNGILNSTRNITAYFPAVEGAYGAEFSPDNHFLYISVMWNAAYLYQLDLINNALTVLDHAEGEYIWDALQLASNGKIYLSRNNESYVGVINNPNASGTDCIYQAHGLDLQPGTFCRLGLPTIPSYAYKPIQISDALANTVEKGALQSEGAQINILPNPIRNATLEINSLCFNQNVADKISLVVLDLKGKIIISKSIDHYIKDYSLDITNLQKGCYILEIFNADEKRITKFLRE
ncbi:MAG: T9SS type A sorting domain-containing protein [Chitinophagales bacterium]|nr:T9SS type A sorting domain-containing protein [Chitinophagales bacterium]